MILKLLLKSLYLPLKKIDKLLPSQGNIYDLGCGEGFISQHLAQKASRQIFAVDSNHSKITSAKKLYNHFPNLKFINQSVFKLKYKNPQGFILSDFLHHLSRKDQNKILTTISRSLKRGGVLIIKEISTQDVIRCRLSRIWDFMLYPQDKINYFSATALINALNKLSFKVKHIKTCQFMPMSTHLFICKKI